MQTTYNREQFFLDVQCRLNLLFWCCGLASIPFEVTVIAVIFLTEAHSNGIAERHDEGRLRGCAVKPFQQNDVNDAKASTAANLNNFKSLTH